MPLLFVERGERVGDVDIGGLDARYFFEDRDGFEREPLIAIMRGDARKASDRLLLLFDADVEVAERVERGVVLRVGLNDAEIFLNGC